MALQPFAGAFLVVLGFEDATQELVVCEQWCVPRWVGRGPIAEAGLQRD
jgi:hypothetical protein